MRWLLICLFLLVCAQANAAARYWVGGGSSANWNATGNTNFGTASGVQDNASVPGSADDVFFDGVGTGASNSTLSAGITIQSIDFTGYANTLTHNAVTLTIGGNGVTAKWVAGMTYTLVNAVTSAVTFSGTSGTTSFTAAGKTFGNLGISGAGGTVRFQDSQINTGRLTLSAGTLDMNNQTFTSSRSATWWNATGGALTNPGTITWNGTAAATFNGGGLTYANFYFTGTSAGAFDLSGSNTFAEFKVDTPPHTVRFTAGTTTTISTWAVSGTAGNLMTIGSITAASHTLSDSAGTNTCNYCSISYSTAQGGATWSATNSTNGGNNSGWFPTGDGGGSGASGWWGAIWPFRDMCSEAPWAC